MRKEIIILLSLLLAFTTACRQQSRQREDTALQQQRDSLNRIIEQKDQEINDMMSTMNDIEDGFRKINEAENRLSVVKQGEGANQAERLRENMLFIEETMQQNRGLINKLRQQLRESSFKGSQLKRTIDNLMRQLEEKNEQLTRLRAELDAKDIHISELDNQVADLNSNVNKLQTEGEQKSQTISSQEKQLNTAWFVYGTKRELAEQHIYEHKKVLQSNFNRDYFTKIDIRVDKEIKLYSRSAKLLTPHAQSSYTLQDDANGQKVLRINNPQVFWSTSKYLVILVK